MAPTDTNPNARRIRWALLIALGLHLLLAWRFLPDLSTTFETVRKAIGAEEVVEIKPAPPLMSRNMAMTTTLGEVPSRKLPKGFFDKPKGMKGGQLEISDDLDFSRKSGVQIVANIIPGALRLRNVDTISEAARTPKPKPGRDARSKAAAEVQSPSATQVAEAEPPPQPTLFQPPATPPPLPFLLPAPEVEPPPPEPELPPEREVDVDAVIARAADDAERAAREARNAATRKAAPDYRAMLPQGAMIEALPPTPREGVKAVDVGAPTQESGITTFALDAPQASDRARAAPEDGNTASAARQQFFALLTARLKAANSRTLAEAIKAGPRTTVRMSFLVDRDGSVVGISPGDPISRALAERAAAVIRSARLPPVPAAMTEVPLELSFPIEVYR